VRARSKKQVPLLVTPRQRPWVGPERTYAFSVTAKPRDAGGTVQRVDGEFTYRPLFPSWAPLWRLLGYTAIALVGAVTVGILLAKQPPTDWLHQLQVGAIVLIGSTYDVPVVGVVCPGPKSQTCTFQFANKDFAEAEPALIGDCRTNESYDRYGNSVQYTTTGVIFWQKEANTSFFFHGNSVWGYIQGHKQLLQGPGAA